MPVSFDTSSPISTDERRRALVDAIIASNDTNGERNWLEWKRELDLSGTKHVGVLAKEVLGMANRDPAVARNYCDGWGYIVIGAHEEGMVGVKAPAPAQLEQKLSPLIGEGDDAPRWEANTVEFQGKTALIVSVHPPREGDPLYALRRKSDMAEGGTIYVRSMEKVQRATPDQLRMLQRRLLMGSFLDRVMERLVHVSSSLQCEIEFEPSLQSWRPTAVIRPREYSHEFAPEIVVHVAEDGIFETSLPPELMLAPLRGNSMIVVFPEWIDLDHAWDEVQSVLAEHFDWAERDPFRSGKTVFVSNSGFGALHQAVKSALFACEGSLPMQTNARLVQVPG